jgi:hypothetical protein
VSDLTLFSFSALYFYKKRFVYSGPALGSRAPDARPQGLCLAKPRQVSMIRLIRYASALHQTHLRCVRAFIFVIPASFIEAGDFSAEILAWKKIQRNLSGHVLQECFIFRKKI